MSKAKKFLSRIYYRLVWYFRNLESRVRFRSVQFFDANMIVRRTNDPKVGSFVGFGAIICATKHNMAEAEVLLANGGFAGARPLKKYHIVSFDDLHAVTPEACPLYYNFISTAFNPATVFSSDFVAHRMNALAMCRRPTRSESKLIERVAMQIKKTEEEINKTFPRRPGDMQGSSVKYHQKVRKAIRNNDKNILNDYRSFVTAFMYCLLNKTNVTYFTMDADFRDIFLTFFYDLAAQIQLKAEVGKFLSKDAEYKRKIMNGDELIFVTDAIQYAESTGKVLGEIYNEYRPAQRAIFKIKYWSAETRKFSEMRVNIGRLEREMMLACAENFSCHYAKNDTFFNWLCLTYDWPGDNLKELKITVKKKGIINNHNLPVPADWHAGTCLYVDKDKKNDFAFFSKFIDAGVLK